MSTLRSERDIHARERRASVTYLVETSDANLLKIYLGSRHPIVRQQQKSTKKQRQVTTAIVPADTIHVSSLRRRLAEKASPTPSDGESFTPALSLRASPPPPSTANPSPQLSNTSSGSPSPHLKVATAWGRVFHIPWDATMTYGDLTRRVEHVVGVQSCQQHAFVSLVDGNAIAPPVDAVMPLQHLGIAAGDRLLLIMGSVVS